MKINFDKMCTCLQKQGYENIIIWWACLTELKNKMIRAGVDGTAEQVFNYTTAYNIVKADGVREMIGCEKHAS